MKSFAAYLMRGRTQAILAISVCAVFALSSPLLFMFAFLGGAIAGLVVLRQGLREGLLVVGSGLLIVAVLDMLAQITPLLAGAYALVFWVPPLMLAWVLRLTGSLGLMVTLGGLFGAVALFVLHGVLGDISAWWVENLQQVTRDFDLALQPAQIAMQSRRMNGVAAGSLFVTGHAGSVMLARWWQSLLYHPGGFREDFYRLRMPRQAGFVAAAVIGFGVMAEAGQVESTLPLELMIVVILMYLLQGLAVVHSLADARNLARGWLTGMYVMLFLVPALSTKLLAGVGLVDVWVNFRAKVASVQPPK